MKLSRLHFPITALGPGRRIGIWFQGCSIRCEGCISVDTWDSGEDEISLDDVLGLTAGWAAEADGVTITGGEPFDQALEVLALIERLRLQLRPDADILVYSGYSLEVLQPYLEDARIDALITDPFLLAQPQTLSLRGSDNQRLHALTPLGRARYSDRVRTSPDDRLDLMVDGEGNAWMAGIPRRGDLERLRLFLSSRGARATTSDHGAARS